MRLLAFLLFGLLLQFVKAQDVDPSKSYAYGEGLTTAKAGIDTQFYIQIADENGTNITSCIESYGSFSIVLTHPNVDPVRGIIIDCNQGLYSAVYIIRLTGKYELSVHIDNVPIEGGKNFTVDGVAGTTFAPECVVNGTGLDGGVAGDVLNLTITAYDQFENRNTSCLVPFSDWKVNVSGGPSRTYEGHVISCANGIYYGEYRVTLAGLYDITITLDDLSAKGSPYQATIVAGPIDAKETQATGSGLATGSAGVDSQFTILSEDQFGNRIDVCLDKNDWTRFEVNLTSGTYTSQGTIVSCTSGQYGVQYNVTKAGTYSLSVTYQGTPISGSPFSPRISPGALCPQSSQLVKPSTGSAGDPYRLIIIPFDCFGNRFQKCPDPSDYANFKTVAQYVDDNSGKYDVNGQITGCKDPYFNISIQFTATKRGNYNVRSTYKGQSFNGAPYALFIDSGALSPAVSQSNFDGQAQIGINNLFTIFAYDKFGNKIYSCDKVFSNWGVVLTPQANGSVIACNGGNYTLAFFVTRLIPYLLRVQYKNVDLRGSPFSVTAHPGPPYPPNCVVKGDGLNYANAGEAAYFTVECSDSYKNPIRECYPLKNWHVDLTGPSHVEGEAFSCENKTSEIAIYNFTYTGYVSGRYDLVVDYSDKSVNITFPTYSVKIIPGPLDPSNFIASGAGVEKNPSNVVGTIIRFIITPRDQYNNTVTENIDTSKFSFKTNPSMDVPPTVENCVGGITSVIYNTTVASVYELDIQFDSTPIKNNPYKPEVYAGAIDPTKAVGSGDALVRGDVGVEERFQVLVYDKYKNRIQTCESDLTSWSVVMTGPGACSGCSIFNCSAGVYTGRYTVTVSGNYTLQVLYKRVQISNSPFHPQIAAGPIDPNQCVISGRQDLYAGVKSELNVVCGDKYKNPVYKCVDTYVWSISSESGDFTFGAFTCSNGVYTVPVTGTEVGQYQLEVQFNQRNVSNSPYVVTVFAGPVDPPVTEALSGVVDARVGEKTTIEVLARDQFENINTTCFNSNHWNVSFRSKDIEVNYVSCNAGHWFWSYTPTVIGKKVLDIVFTDTAEPTKPIKDSPFTIDIIAGPIAANNTYATGEGLYNTVAGENAEFYVHVVDAFGNNITVCENTTKWTVTLVCAGVSFPVNFECDKEPPYVGTYNATKKGSCDLSILYENTPIKNSTFHPIVVPGPIYNSTSYGQPDSTATAGVEERFDIVAADRFNNIITECDDSTFPKWTIKLVHVNTSKEFDGEVFQCSNGRYEARYNTTLGGDYKLYVYWNGDNTKFSPFNVFVTSGDIDPTKSRAYGLGVTGEVPAGTFAPFKIVAYDRYDNKVTKCVSNPNTFWSVVIDLPNNVSISVPNKNCNSQGEYDVIYNVTQAGFIYVHVKGQTIPTIGSPFKVLVIAGPVDPQHSKIQNVQNGIAGEPLEFELHIYDFWFNQITTCTLNTSDFTAKTVADHLPVTSTWNITGCEKGIYKVGYQQEVADTYKAYAYYKGAPVVNNGQNFTIIEGNITISSFAYGYGVESQAIPAGTFAHFYIQSRNQYNVNVTVCLNFTRWSFESTPAVVHPGFTVDDCVSGVYRVHYNATVATQYEIIIKLDGQAISRNPYKPAVIPGPPYPPNTDIYGPTINTEGKDEGWFVIQAADIYHNNVTDTSKYNFTARLTPTCAHNVTVECNHVPNTGEYNCTYSVGEGGVYCIDIFYEGSLLETDGNYRLLAKGGRNCEKSCNYNGLCFEGKCFCDSGYTSNSCETKIHSKYMRISAAIGIIVGLAILCLIIGLVLGYFFSRYSRRGGDNQPLLA
jgi:hypothetical protein